MESQPNSRANGFKQNATRSSVMPILAAMVKAVVTVPTLTARLGEIITTIFLERIDNGV
jgi:hypothetical protein